MPSASSWTTWASQTRSNSVGVTLGGGLLRRCRLLLGALAFFSPRHHGAQPRADLLDRVLLRFAPQLSEPWRTGAAFRDPFFRERPAADVGEQPPHLLTHRRADDAVAARQIAVFGGIADRMPHEAETAAVDEIHDELQLVQTLEVRHLRRVPGVGQRLEPGLNER